MTAPAEIVGPAGAAARRLPRSRRGRLRVGDRERQTP
jgi:hypothetical protein